MSLVSNQEMSVVFEIHVGQGNEKRLTLFCAVEHGSALSDMTGSMERI
jgi:hypothetical protein